MNKRAISLLLAIVMLLSTITSPIYAVGQNLPKDKVEAGNEVPYTNEGNKKIFKIDKRAIKEVKGPQRIATRSTVQSNGPKPAPVQATRTEKMTVKLTTKGLGNGAQNFDWSLFNNSKFTAELVIYDVDNNEYYPQKNGRPVTIDFTKDGEQTIDFDVPVTLDVDSYNIVVKTMDNFEVRAWYEEATTSPSGAELKLEFTVIELASPFVEVIYQDSQGQNLAADKLPTTTGVNITAEGVKLARADLSIPLPTQNTKYNIAQGIPGKGRATTQALNNLTDAIKYKVDGKDSGLITLGNKEFKLSITNSLKDGSQIVLTLSKADQLKELGGLNPKTIKVWKADTIDWKKGVEPVDDNNSAAVWDLIEEATVTDITTPNKRDSSKAGKFPGKLKLTFDDGSSLEVDKQMLIVSEHVVVVDPNNTDPDAPQNEDLPRDKITVIFKAGEGIVNINTNGKTTYAKPNATLADTDFPTNITYKDGYKNEVTWEPTDHKVDTNNRKYYNGKRNTFTFNASATKNDTSADKITKAGGLAPKATAAFVGDTLNWAGSAVLSDTAKQAANATELQGLLDKATITDATDPARTSAAAGEFTGKVKVTFEDKSFIEVDKQILYVYENGAKKPGSDKPVPTDAATVTFTKDDKSIKDWGTVEPIIVKKNKAVPSDKFPNAQAKDGYNTVAWSPAQNTVITGDQTFNASATSNTPTKNSEDYDPHYTGKSGKPGETVRIDAPTFTKKGVNGNVPAPTTPTKGTTFANNDPTQNNVTVDPNTGAITVAIPQDAPVGSIITIEVKVTYPDTSYDTVKVSVTVTDNTQPKPEDDKSKTPIVDPVNDGDTSISGKGEPGSDIIINVPGKDPIKTTVDDGGKWIAPIDPAHEGDVIEVIQIEVGKKPSDPAYVTVGGRSIIVPGHDDGGHWWFGGGSFKPVETEEQVIDKTEHGIHIAYIFGYKDHTFRCEGKITRAEAASMIAHIAKLDLSDNSKPDFKDTPSSWYNAAINAMVKKNLMFADKNGNFRPNEPITRGEFARAIQFIDKENKKEAPFMDIKGHEFEEAINQAYSNGRIAGYPDGTFKPDESITRAEAVTILNNFDGRMVRERGIEDVKKDLIKFTDLIPSHWAYYEIIEASNSHAYSRISNDSKEEKWSNLIK
ncbi:hypothetical protein HMPREF9131_0781 [Peptoniphilus sp. oral taxon 836 str. F0141]|nr:S-layer homology domain-containing protein [Peptoniphilus sp. oral taxon 836]EFK38740.1 hypothetical protein HMPREF9131_0781 [Peptoniphilus sp. oral taxon 836 str. F0141]